MAHRRTLAAAGLVGLMLTAAACGGDSSDESTAGDAGTGPTHVRVTSLALCNEMAQYALDSGIFSKHGLDVELVKTVGGAAGLAAVQSDSADIAFVNPITTLTAIEKGVPIKVISGSGLTTEESHGVIVGQDAGINGPADLDGKTIAVNELGGTGQFLTTRWIEEALGHETSAKFVALSFPDLVPAVEEGKVDAAQVTSTQIVLIENDGRGRSVGNPIYDGVGATPGAYYVAMDDFVEKNAGVAESFAAAMEEAAVAGNDPANNDAKFAVMEKYCKTPAATLSSIPEMEYEGLVDMTALGTIEQVALDGGLLKESIDLTTIVPEFARDPEPSSAG